MTDLAEALKIEAKASAKRAAAKTVVTAKTFTMQGLRRLALWGAAAGGAMFVAALTSRSEVGLKRVAAILHGRKTQTQAATPAFDAQAETQRLGERLRGLNANNEQIKARLAAVERDMNDVTGSITKKIEAADAARRSEDGPSLAATAMVTASMAAPAIAPSAAATQLPPLTEAAAPRTAYGVDIGSGLTIQDLRTRWATLRNAHPELLSGLEPLVSVKEVPRANRIELRLIAGPIAHAGGAAQLCASLMALGLFCQPTIFDGQHLAAR